MNDQTARVLTVVDQWANWRRRLAGEAVPIHDGEVDSGYYRIRRGSGKPYVPVAFWRDDDGDLCCVIDGVQCSVKTAHEQWIWAVQNPISETEFRKFEAGGDWSDIDPQVARAQNGRGIGDNSGALDEAEAIKEQIESASAGIKEYATITDDATRDRAQTLRSRLLELSGNADRLREALKRPHFEASKAVDTKWQPLVKAAKTAADTIRAALSAWETVKFQRQQEAQRKAADAARAQYEEANKAMVAGKPIPPPPTIPPPEPVMPTKFKGGAGRSASTSVVKTIKAVTDWPALIAHYQVTQEVRDLILELAKKSVKHGFIPPGVEIQDGVDVR